MPVFPNYPGIPPLLNFQFPLPPTLLLADQVDAGQFSKRWGVFKGGRPVIEFDAFISIDFRRGWVLADFPLEQGAFESYDKVSLPFDVRVKFAAGGSIQRREALLASIESIAKTLELYDVVTPEVVYSSVNVQHYDYRRTATNGNGLLTVELWLLEVRIGANANNNVLIQTGSSSPTSTTTTTGSTDFFATGAPPLNFVRDPSGFTAFNAGAIQSSPPTAGQIAQLSGEVGIP